MSALRHLAPRLRLTVALTLAALGPLAGAAAAPALAAGGELARCERTTIAGHPWGVYVQAGATPCATAAQVLAGVVTGRGRDVVKGPGVEYWLYEGWACPYNQMGEAFCDYGSRPVAHPARVIVARACGSVPGSSCPARTPAD